MKKPRAPHDNDPKPQDNDLCVGDLHADLDGFQKLLKKAKWNADTQKIFLLGDVLDRGHQAKELLDFIRNYGISSIIGNHCYFHYRFSQHLIEYKKSRKKNPMHLSPEKKNTFEQFANDEEYIQYMTPIIDDFPLYLPFEVSWGKGFLLHGGVDPFNSIEQQEPDKMLVRRYHPSPDKFIENETEEYKYWQKSYTGHLGTIISGHHPVPNFDFHQNPYTISLDGGGVMGEYSKGTGVHRLMRLGDRVIFECPPSVEAVQNYYRIKNAK